MCWRGIQRQIKALYKDKTSGLILVTSLLLALIPTYHRLSGAPHGSLLSYVYGGSISAVYYFFIFFLFLGYYTVRLSKNFDSFSVIPEKEPVATIQTHLFFCGFLWLATSFLLVLPNIIAYRIDNQSYPRYFASILLDLLFFMAFSEWIAFLVGYLFGLIRNLYLSIVGILVFALAASPLALSFATKGSSFLAWIVFLTPFVPRGNQFAIDYHFWQFGWYRFCNSVLWIALLSLILLFILRARRWTKLVAGALSCIALIMILVSERTLTGLEWSSGTIANYYYRLYIDSSNNLYTESQNNDVCKEFQVSSYDLNIHCFPHFSATATLQISERANNERLVFTLYHGYNVSSVEDSQGNDLSFERSDDWLFVSLPPDQSTITVCYSGQNGPCYAGIDGIYLRPGFPFYPIAGKQTPVSPQGGFQFCEHKTAEFNVKIHSPQKIYSNLPGKGNSFSGKSDAPMFVSGYLTEKTIASTRIILPEICLADMTAEEVKMWTDLISQSLSSRNHKPQCIIFGNSTSEIMTSEIIEFSDYTFVPFWASIGRLKEQGLFGELETPDTQKADK